MCQEGWLKLEADKDLMMVRSFFSLFLCVCSFGQFVSAATISAVIKPNLPIGSPTHAGQGFINTTDMGLFGTVADVGFGLGVVPTDNGQAYDLIATTSKTLAAGTAGTIRTTARREELNSQANINFYTTTYSYFTNTGLNVNGDSFTVINSAYWEFTVNGIYNYTIYDGTVNLGTRTFRFENGSGTLLPNSGSLSSGTYRLFYNHTNANRDAQGPEGNILGGTDLNALFTFQSEDNNVVPEPASVAVFGSLGLMAMASKWRRNKPRAKK